MIIFVILTVVEGYFPEISSKAPEISSPCLCHLRPPCPPPYYCPISVVCPPPQPIICPPPCPPVKPPSCPVIPCPAAPPCPIFCPPIPPCPPPVIRCPRTCPPALPPSPSPPAYLPLQYDNKFPHTDFAATPYFSSHQNNNKGRYGYGNCVINGPSGSILDQQHFDFPSEATTMENIHFPSISESNLQVEPSIIDHETKQTSTANFANIDADLTTTLPDISELQQESEIKSDQHSLFQLLNIEKTNYTTQAAYTSQKTERKYFIRNGCPPNDSSCIDNDDSGTLPENDCCTKCNDPCRFRQMRKILLTRDQLREVDPICNNELLKQIIIQYANDNNTRTKVEIQRAAQQLLGGLFGVICGSDDFAYIIQTNDFCQHRTANTTCYVFRSKMIY